MPVVAQSSFKPSRLLLGRDAQSIFPTLSRKKFSVQYERERILTADQDFLDLDWSRIGSNRLIILSHGLEGSSSSGYILRFVESFNQKGWDVLAWNLRGCSEEINKKPHWYHSGLSSDLCTVFSHALFSKRYSQISHIGFSLGGNILLKFLGEGGKELASLVHSAVAFSVPVDLKSSALELSKLRNRIYMSNFKKALAKRVKQKSEQFPEKIAAQNFAKVKTFKDFDSLYTAPLNGFRDEEHYWAESSSLPLLDKIAVPTLLVNALNDPMLGPECYPRSIASQCEFFTLETPESGGHVGFLGRDGYWDVERASEWFEKTSANPSE